MDSLTYSYISSLSNQLKAVKDTASKIVGFIDGNRSSTDYSYDYNGNLIQDLNKGITSIRYNFLNLPLKIKDGSNDSITYYYDATGTKIKQEIRSNGNLSGRYYFDGFEYKNSKILALIHMDEGVINMDSASGSFTYEYFLKDHLGNTRIAVRPGSNNSITLKQSTDYYPFGLAFSNQYDNSSGNKYLYNGKEIQDASIGGNLLDWYDYGARFYDPQIGRWHVVDPLAEQAYEWSPYRYAFNNPIRIIDPSGMLETKYEDEQHNLLLETNDRNNSTVTVTKDNLQTFNNYVSYMKFTGSLNSPLSNAELIEAITPETQGQFFTDQTLAWLYMDVSLYNNRRENLAFTVDGGVVVEPTEGFDIISNAPGKNNFHSGSLYLQQKTIGNSLYVILNGKQYKITNWIHNHPYIIGGYNDGANVFSEYASGDKGFYEANFKGKGIGRYLIGPKDVVKWTESNPNKVIGNSFDLLYNGNKNIIK